MAYGDLVSCLCVTRNRVALLRRAVQCFLRQTYAQKELILLYESDDIATRYFVAQLNEPSVLAIEVSATPRLTLGSLRNLAVRVSRGDYVAQWDDDDWHAPTRIVEQMQAMEQHGRPGCVLLRWLLYDEVTHTAMVSHTRPWEGSLLASRDAMPLYADLAKFEDTPAVTLMLNQDKLVGLDSPQLYVYVYHGSNTWERSHWEHQIAPFATALNEEDTEKVRNALYGPL